MAKPSSGSARWKFYAVLGSLLICALFGGSSRGDSLAQIPSRLASLGLVAALLVRPDRERLRTVQLPLILLGGLALLMICQMIPLPPAWWRTLPGRTLFVQIADAADLGRVWRPISLAPDLTLNSLLALLPAVAALVGTASLNSDQRRFLFTFLPAVGLTSAVVGLIQSYTGSLYFYISKTVNDPLGLFANRNHQALFLATMLPFLMEGLLNEQRKGRAFQIRAFLSVAIGTLLSAEILVVGSRAGFALLLVAVAAISVRAFLSLRVRASRRSVILILGVLMALAGSMFLAVHLAGRDQALERFFIVDESIDQRSTMLPSVLKMTWDLFPFGAGFGTFDWVFRAWEPDQWLSYLHYNHAHDDFIELVYEGGLPAVMLAVVFLWWLLRHAVAAWRRPLPGGFGRSSTIAIGLMFLSSLVDYPLRTPLLSALCAICVACLGAEAAMRSRDKAS